jgi:uncharacterized membrane protein
MRLRTYRSLLTLGAAFGLIAALFAGLEFYDLSLTAVCTVNAFFSCALIAESGKTTTLGVQDYLWGIGGFVAILLLAVAAERRRRDARLAYLVLGVTTAGVAFAAYFLYVELAEIGGLCPVCLTAYLCGVVAWIGALGLARHAYRRRVAPAPTAADAA